MSKDLTEDIKRFSAAMDTLRAGMTASELAEKLAELVRAMPEDLVMAIETEARRRSSIKYKLLKAWKKLLRRYK